VKIKLVNLLTVIVTVSIFLLPEIVKAHNHPSGELKGGIKIPYNPQFPKAQYPYAQAPDGCSIPISGSAPGDWDGFAWLGNYFSFTETCNTHDKCYYTLGTEDNSCNDNFFVNLSKACKKGVSGDPTIWDAATLLQNRNTAFAYCESRAFLMTQSTGMTQLKYHKDAQLLQQRYEEYVDKIRPKPAFKSFVLELSDEQLLEQKCKFTSEHGRLFRKHINIFQNESGPILVENATSSPINVSLYDASGNKQSVGAQVRPQIPSWIPNNNTQLKANGDWAIRVGDGCLHYIGEEAQFSNKGGFFYLRYTGKEEPLYKPTSQDPECQRPREHNNRFTTNTGAILVVNKTSSPINVSLYDASGNKQSVGAQVRPQIPSWIPNNNTQLKANGDWAIQVGDGCLHYIGEEARFSEIGSYFVLEYTGDQ